MSEILNKELLKAIDISNRFKVNKEWYLPIDELMGINKEEIKRIYNGEN